MLTICPYVYNLVHLTHTPTFLLDATSLRSDVSPAEPTNKPRASQANNRAVPYSHINFLVDQLWTTVPCTASR